MSLQIFQSIILNHEDGIRRFGHATKIKRVSTLFTFRMGTGYLGDTILPDVFVGYDPAGYYSVNPAITYQPPGMKRFNLTLTSAIYGGHNKFGGLGFFSEKDSVFLQDALSILSWIGRLEMRSNSRAKLDRFVTAQPRRMFCCSSLLLLSLRLQIAAAAEADLKPGDTIGPQNWQRSRAWSAKIC